MVGCTAVYNPKSKFAIRRDIESRARNNSFDFNENIPLLNTTSNLGYISKKCGKFFDKLDKISEDMENGNRIELDVEAIFD